MKTMPDSWFPPPPISRVPQQTHIRQQSGVNPYLRTYVGTCRWARLVVNVRRYNIYLPYQSTCLSRTYIHTPPLRLVSLHTLVHVYQAPCLAVNPCSASNLYPYLPTSSFTPPLASAPRRRRCPPHCPLRMPTGTLMFGFFLGCARRREVVLGWIEGVQVDAETDVCCIWDVGGR